MKRGDRDRRKTTPGNVDLNRSIWNTKIHIDAITPNAIYKTPLESKVVLRVNVRIICLFESNSNNIKIKKKIKTPNEIGITKWNLMDFN